MIISNPSFFIWPNDLSTIAKTVYAHLPNSFIHDENIHD